MDQQRLARGALVFAAAVPAAAILTLFLRHAAAGLAERQDQRASLTPLIEEARLWPMTYETATPGKPVFWCVDHPSKEVSYLAGMPSRPLEWTNEPAVPANGPTTGGRCGMMVARVVARKEGSLLLEYLGSP
jgi:hypothetical protein